WFYPYPEWGTQNPDECWTDDQGLRAYGTWGNRDGFTDDLSRVPPGRIAPWWYPSYNSRKWREDASAAAAALLEHLRQTPYGKTLAGYFISGGHDGQFQVFGSYDYSEGSRLAFAQWLRGKYATLDKLREVWGADTPASFEAVRVPPPPPQGNGMEGGTPYLSPGPALDYRDFATAQTWGLRDEFSAVVKRAAGKPVFTVAYGNPAQYDFSPLMSLKSLDASAAMSYYPYRNAGYALGFKPQSGFPLHNKLFFQEIDTRSWAGSVHGDEVYQMWIGAGLTPPEWQAINRKLAGISLANQTGFWYYDMNHFFDAPEIMAEIGKTVAEARRLRSRPSPRFRPQVCVVQAGEQGKFLSSDASVLNSSHFYQLMAFEQSGVPYDLQYLSDVLSRPELQQYKAYVFYQTRYLTKAERQGIRAKLQRGGKTLIFMHDDGYLSEQGKSVAAQSELVGMKVQTEERYARQTPLLVPGPLTAGCQPFIGLTENLMQIMVQEGQSSFAARAQPFWIDDPSATPLARYAEDGRTAAAIKKLSGWTSVYVAAPSSLTGDLLNSLARQAGAYVVGPAGQSVAMNGQFLSLHALQSGSYTINLPPGVTRVTDVDNAKALPATKGQCRLSVVAQKTYWLEFE
ncbi:MAG: beta-galactosidase, partial [Armatimonadota bacterium]